MSAALKPKDWNGKAGIVAMLTGVAALGTIHAVFVVPGILGAAHERASQEFDRQMRQHSAQPHSGAVSERELSLVLEQLRAMDARIGARLTRIEERLK